MQDLHSVTAFCSKKVWSLLLFHTQAFLVSQQAVTDGRWVPWLAAGGGSQSPGLSEALQELLELGDDLRVHRFHEGLEALLAQELLLCLELLVGELLQGHGVHRVLQGQLWDREDHTVSKGKTVPLTRASLKFFIPSPTATHCPCLPSHKIPKQPHDGNVCQMKFTWFV